MYSINIVWSRPIPYIKAVYLYKLLNSKTPYYYMLGFPDSSVVGKDSTHNAGDPVSIPWSGRSARERIGYPPHYSWASLVAQLVKNLPPMRETWV